MLSLTTLTVLILPLEAFAGTRAPIPTIFHHWPHERLVRSWQEVTTDAEKLSRDSRPDG